MLIYGKRAAVLLTLISLLVHGSNYNVGGGGTVPGPMVGGTAGSVLFINPTDTVSQNNSSFYWDDASKQLKLSKTSLATTPTTSMLLQNTTAATAGTQVQVSPAIEWTGTEWDSGLTSSKTASFRAYLLPRATSSNRFGTLKFQGMNNAGTHVDLFTLNNSDAAAGGLPRATITQGLNISGDPVISDIGVRSHLILDSTGAEAATLAFKLGGNTFRAGIKVPNDGEMQFHSADEFSFYYSNPITSPSLLGTYNTTGFINTAGNFNTGKVTAGAQDTTPPATLTTFGSFAAKGRRVTADTTLDHTASMLYCDSTNAAFCGGTATACGSKTYTQCADLSLIGCSQNTAGTCSDKNGTNSSECTSYDAICSWTPANCSVFNNNSAGCAGEATCSFTPAACGDFTTISACDAQSGNGCTSNTDACINLLDEGSCNAESADGCSWNGLTCDGSNYLTSCSGSYSGGDGVCSGTYDSGGTCSGGSFGTCIGTASCGNLTDDGETECNLSKYDSCAWTTGLTVNLPAISSHMESDTGFLAYIYKVNSGGGSVTMDASGTDTIRDGTSSAGTLAISAQGSNAILHPRAVYSSCTGFGDEGSCTPTGCSWSGSCTGEYISSYEWSRFGN